MNAWQSGHILNSTLPRRRQAPETGWRTVALTMMGLQLAQLAWILS